MVSELLFGRNDLSIYEEFADEWWQPESPRFRSLQNITGFRLTQLLEWTGSVSGKTIVDLGCGGGLLSVPLLNLGADVTGIDISQGSLNTAAKAANGRGSFIRGSCTSVPLSNNSADIVLLADVLDHIPDYHLALGEAKRILKHDGMLYVSTINRTFLSWLLVVNLGEMVRLIPPGTHQFGLLIKPSELARNANKASLKLVELQGEVPNPIATLKKRAITFQNSTCLSLAYSALFRA